MQGSEMITLQFITLFYVSYNNRDGLGFHEILLSNIKLLLLYFVCIKVR